MGETKIYTHTELLVKLVLYIFIFVFLGSKWEDEGLLKLKLSECSKYSQNLLFS
jgi:hypothetical protein